MQGVSMTEACSIEVMKVQHVTLPALDIDLDPGKVSAAAGVVFIQIDQHGLRALPTIRHPLVGARAAFIEVVHVRPVLLTGTIAEDLQEFTVAPWQTTDATDAALQCLDDMIVLPRTEGHVRARTHWIGARFTGARVDDLRALHQRGRHIYNRIQHHGVYRARQLANQWRFVQWFGGGKRYVSSQLRQRLLQRSPVNIQPGLAQIPTRMARAEESELAQSAGIAKTRRRNEVTEPGLPITKPQCGKPMQLAEQQVRLSFGGGQRLEQTACLLAITRTMPSVHQQRGERHLRRNQFLRGGQTQPMQTRVELPPLVQQPAQSILSVSVA